jgi:sortase A
MTGKRRKTTKTQLDAAAIEPVAETTDASADGAASEEERAIESTVQEATAADEAETEDTEPSGYWARRRAAKAQRAKPRGIRRVVRLLGNAILVFGVLLIAYIGVVVYWGDPYTSWITSHRQHHLSQQLDTQQGDLKKQLAKKGQSLPQKGANLGDVPLGQNGQPLSKGSKSAAASQTLSATELSYAKSARAYAKTVKDGQALGRIRIGVIGLNMVYVQGTSEHDLTYGPGHYAMTGLPGTGGVVAIAGHRTTYLHPFRHIDAIKAGSYITLDMPYGRFTYRVYKHRIVAYNDWSILIKQPFEKLVLSACHPLYSASHRFIIYGRLVKEEPASGAQTLDTATNHATG